MRRSAILAFFLAAAAPAAAWDSHGELTRLALSGLPAMAETVLPETLEEYLAAVRYPGGLPAFLRDNQLNPKASFVYRAGEGPGVPLPLLAAAATYADEPDWEMDNGLFQAYPGLWKPQYRYMVGAPEGLQTRAVRHMFWPRGYLSEPAAGGRVPVHNAEPLGLAHERAERYFKLSRQAFAEGHHYWGARFLGWSLHYVEDLTQPFHAVQLPAFELLRFVPGGGIDLEKTTRTVAFYHLSVDGFAGAGYRGHVTPAAKARLEAALAGADAAPFAGALRLAEDTAMEASGGAKRLALAAEAFFPEPTDAHLADPVARVWGPGYWQEVAALMASEPEAGEAFLRQVEARLRAFGPRARGLAAAALDRGAPTARLDRAKMLERVDRILQRAIIVP